jgi:hypothetical protein
MTVSPEHKKVRTEVAHAEGDTVLTKWRCSAFFRTELLEQIRESGRDQLIGCGVYAHVGVRRPARDRPPQDRPSAGGDPAPDRVLCVGVPESPGAQLAARPGTAPQGGVRILRSLLASRPAD